MRKGTKIISLIVGALSLLGFGTAFAAQNPDFFGWTVDNGQVRTGASDICNNGQYECSVIADGSGFLQRQVTAIADAGAGGSGESFIQTIVTDQDATGDSTGGLNFYDVTFVKMTMNLGAGINDNQNGIAAIQVIEDNETNAGTNFRSETGIQTGWAQDVTGEGSSPITIIQNLSDMGDETTQGDDFISDFYYQATLNTEVDSADYGKRTGFSLDLDQTVGLMANNGIDTDTQVFKLSERQGTFSAASGSAELGGTSQTWGPGDDVKAIWIGQEVDLGSTTGTPGGGSMMGSTFGYLSFQNVTTDPTNSANEFGFGANNAKSAWGGNWDENTFGAGSTPCLRKENGVCVP